MLDPVIKESLESVLDALNLITRRFKSIKKSEDLIGSETGLTIMDAVPMRLQLIGEKIKKIEQKEPGLLSNAGIDPKPIIRFRDFISHHYDEADYEVLYDVCQNHLPGLKDKIVAMLAGQQYLKFE